MAHSLAELGWRSFNFFNLVPIQDKDKATVLQGIDICEWSAGDGFVLFGEPKGAILQMSARELDVRFFKAFHQRLLHFAHAQQKLIAIGVDDGEETAPIVPPSSSIYQSSSSSPPLASSTPVVLKLWNLASWQQDDTVLMAPNCAYSCTLNFGRKVDTAQATVIATSPKLDIVVIGMANSSMFYYHGDLQRCSTTSGPKWLPLRESTNPAKDGRLAGIAVGRVRDNTVVCCLTDKLVQSYVLNSAGQPIKTILHDAKGCEHRCWFFQRTTNQLIVAGREMVHFYDMSDCLELGGENGRCHALGRGSEKVQLVEREGQIALLTEQEAQIPSLKATSSSSDGNTTINKTTSLNLYDIESRYIAFFCSMPSPCRLFTLGGELYLVNADGLLHRLVEEPMERKLDILLRKNLFDLAISIARRRKSDELLKDIYLKYGDYLYQKGDFENAIQQYINTFRHVEPSRIIKKFLDGPRTAQLCQYLEALHTEGLAIGHHTTLLLSVYVKLNALDKLEQFLDKDGAEHLAREGFDVDASIKLLRSAQLFHLASKLALKCHRHHTFLDILVDTAEWERALRFIEKLPTPMACEFLEVHGPALLDNCEQLTLELIKRLICEEGANLKQLTKALISKPQRMEELFGELSLVEELKKDAQVRDMLLEQKLKKYQQQQQKEEGEGNQPSKEQFEELLSLLGPDRESLEHALLLAQRYNCAPLIIHISRTLNRTEELFRYMVKEGDIVAAVELYGESRSVQDMWIELISYGATSKATKKEDLLALLDKVSKSNCLNPLVVLELLSRDESLQVGDIRDFIIGWLERQNSALRANEHRLTEQEQQLVDMHHEIEDLENNVQVYQVAKCTVCNNALQVPAVHFLCRHSYHANCFESYSGSKPDECPACGRAEEKEQQQEQRDQDGSATQPQQQFNNYLTFKNELANASNPMALISEYLASGQFSHHASCATVQKGDDGDNKSYNPFDEEED